MSHFKPDCLFCKIAAGQIPSKKIFEDDDMLVFHDIHPVAPVHFLMIPKRHVDNLYGPQDEAVLGKILGRAGLLATELGSTDGFRVVINNGHVGRQEVYHLHVHVMGGSQPLGSGMNRGA
jgi:histidine triad (HIT) family protein